MSSRPTLLVLHTLSPEHLAQIGAGTTVADIGAGEGYYTVRLAERVGAKGRVLVTTFASNAARLQTQGEVARDTGRRICVAGRSISICGNAGPCR